MPSVETKNLLLIAGDTAIMRAAIDGNEILAKELNVIVPDDWTEFGVGALQYSLDRISQSKEENGWWTYLPIHKASNKLIGSGGYKGGPTPEGTVEIGYEIAPNYRNRGLATEMAKGLIKNAFNDNRVKSVIAHTLGEENPSTRVLQKCGFIKVDEIDDPDDGLLWRWEFKRG